MNRGVNSMGFSFAILLLIMMIDIDIENGFLICLLMNRVRDLFVNNERLWTIFGVLNENSLINSVSSTSFDFRQKFY